MKLQFLIFTIFLITLVESESIYNATTMYSGSEKTFYSLTANKNQYYTISATRNYKYTFKIKIKSSYISSSSYLSLSYIGHSSIYPNTNSYNNEDQGSLYCTYTSTSSGYITYEYSYTVTKSFIYYLTFVLTPKNYIDSVSITITENYSSNISDSTSSIAFIIIFFTIFIFCAIFCVIFFVCRAFCECFKNSTVIQTSPQPNYTPLTPQYQQPQPIQPQPQYMAPPQYNQPNQYVQSPQYINPQQNINGYAPGQLYATS